MTALLRNRFSPYLIVISLIILLGFLSYGNALKNDIIWDDHVILEGTGIKNLQLSTLARFFTDKNVYHAPGEIYRPFYLLSFAIDYQLYDTHPWGYHLTNIIMHIANSILVFLVASSLLNTTRGSPSGNFSVPLPRQLIPAAFTALIFTVHPIHTESVTWIKGRDDVIAFFFFMVSFYLFVAASRTVVHEGHDVVYKAQGNRGLAKLISGRYLFSLLFYTFALFSKEMAITLPLLCILYGFLFLSLSFKDIKRWLIYLPYFIIAGLYFIIRTNVLGQIAQTAYLGGSLSSAMYTMTKVFVMYLRLLIVPVNLCGDYMGIAITTKMDTAVIYSFFIILAILFIGFISIPHSRLLAFSIFWIFITLLPVSNIIPIKIQIAERFLYLPSFGAFLLVGIGARWIIGSSLSSYYKYLLLALFIIPLTLYSYGTVERNKVWKSEFSFWGDVIKKHPTSRAYTSLGLAYMEEGKVDRAIYHYGRALSLNQKDSYALNNLAVAYLKKGLIDKAIILLKSAIKIDSDNPLIYMNMGIAYYKIGLFKEAAAAYQVALSINPGNKTAKDYLDALRKEQQKDKIKHSKQPQKN
jgi:hypothetical protein